MCSRWATGSSIEAAAPSVPAEPVLPRDFAELAAFLEGQRRFQLAEQVRHLLRPIRFEGTEIEFASAKPLPQDFVRELGAALRETTGKNWKLLTGSASGGQTLREQQAANEAAEREAVLASPVVAAAMAAFPEAELIGWSKTGS